ncbi:hypothetical protein FG064_18465 [Vibrio cholerae]|uniref:hypothetical protein n=1 Tax=Vibrio cholerae TaxID=666 RepID=UPI0011D546E1|nr:hypothetical protein [Vibrio cholerae]EGR0468965.1 hypothetical protein [Vibrio cholerae]EGR2527690.1 hypothetical protein [Vibrio cholerae]TXZ67118.1 hypothetical protein FXE27_13985 [Vibrio cholerae]GIB66569.1 hypothetical protein VCSRO47_3496 [Vibrio cholerae]
MLQSTYSDKSEDAFVLHENDLRKLWQKLEAYGCSVTATVKFSDKVERKVSNIENLLGFENSKKRSIQSIKFQSRSEDGHNWTSIEFDSSIYRTITVSSSGDDELVTKVSDELTEFTSGIKPWYSSVSRLDVFWLIFVPFVLVFMFADMMHASSSEDVALTFRQSATAIGVIAAILLGLYLSHKILGTWKNYLFPIASFAIGQGAKRYKNQDQLRFTVVIGFIVSIAASLFVGFFG